MQTDVLMLVNLTLKRLASRGYSSHKFTAESQKGAMVYSQENEEKTLHPLRGPRFEPQKGKLSSKNHTVTKCKKHVYVEKRVRGKIHYPLKM